MQIIAHLRTYQVVLLTDMPWIIALPQNIISPPSQVAGEKKGET